MKSIPIYIIDAFTSSPFRGNPAAVCVLNERLDDALMQKIGSENNLSETAFLVPCSDGYEIRWFTPKVEVDLCGHATLASSFVLFDKYIPQASVIHFKTRKRGMLSSRRFGDQIVLDFPADPPLPCSPPPGLIESIGIKPIECLRGITDYMLVCRTAKEIINIAPDFNQLREVAARGVMITAPGDETDFVSRFFAPQSGINEDPVTGSAHTTLTPYWSHRLGKKEMTAKQLSARGGDLFVSLAGDRVHIAGSAHYYLTGEIFIP
jgi:PhzF family phenazine biosynthesis protein